MKAPRISSGFFLSISINLLINWMGSIPAWVLLVLHFWLDIPIFWFWIALCIWISRHVFFVIISSAIYGLGYKLREKSREKILKNEGENVLQFSTEVKEKTNKNPFSSKK